MKRVPTWTLGVSLVLALCMTVSVAGPQQRTSRTQEDRIDTTILGRVEGTVLSLGAAGTRILPTNAPNNDDAHQLLGSPVEIPQDLSGQGIGIGDYISFMAFENSGSLIARQVSLMRVSIVISSDFVGDIYVAEEEDLVLLPGVTVTGNIEVNGVLLLLEGSTVIGDVEGGTRYENVSSLILDRFSTVEGTVRGTFKVVFLDNMSEVDGAILINDPEFFSCLDASIEGDVMADGMGLGLLYFISCKVNGTMQTWFHQYVEVHFSDISGDFHSMNDMSVVLTNNNIGGNTSIFEFWECTEEDNNYGGWFAGCLLLEGGN